MVLALAKSLLLLTVLCTPLFAGTVKVGMDGAEVIAKDWLNTPQALTLAALKGKVVVVEFWATWCPPCRQSIPHLIKMQSKYQDKGVVILGLTNEPLSAVKAFAEKMKMNYPVGTGSKSAGVYGVEGLPTAFVIGADGKVAWSGHPMSGLEPAIERALAQKGAAN